MRTFNCLGRMTTKTKIVVNWPSAKANIDKAKLNGQKAMKMMMTMIKIKIEMIAR